VTLFSENAPSVRRVTLVRLSALVARAASDIGPVAVEGEVHRVNRGKTGRLWFVLRDRAAQVHVSVPAARLSRCRVVAAERVCVVGRLEWISEWGQLQLLAEEVTPVGAGAVAAAVAEARQRLADDGLLARPRRPIPPLPAAIGVVCGFEAAVRADIESVVAARFPGYPVVFRETTVSGPGAVDRVVEALSELGQRGDVEVIILARGGGDATQLLPFSDEAVCRAVCATPVPVVSAIGHHGDRPLVDEVADLRCGTPSLAAAAVVPDREALHAQLGAVMVAASAAAAARLARAAQRLDAVDRRAAIGRGLERAGGRLDRARGRLVVVHPSSRLKTAGGRLERIDAEGPLRRRVDGAVRQLAAVRREADALSPARVLERGYAVVRRSDGAVVRSASEVVVEERVAIEVARGRISALVESATEAAEP
jgi:exodeoxyribonuclease VII large subunit